MKRGDRQLVINLGYEMEEKFRWHHRCGICHLRSWHTARCWLGQFLTKIGCVARDSYSVRNTKKRHRLYGAPVC